MLFVLGIICLFWIISGVDLIYGVLFRIPVLTQANAPAPQSFPKISIIFAARDEAKHIHNALSSFLALNYPNFEVIAVNDRSTDETLARMRSLQDERLKIIDIQDLPDHWIGKNHALQAGYKASSGTWLVFTDGDVIFQDPRTLQFVLGISQKEAWDHMALLPRMVLKGVLEKLFTTSFGLGFYFHFRPWAASVRGSKAHMGVGAFNFIRREVYEKIGTHEGFRMNVLDDMELGRRVKVNGFSQTAVFGHELISVPWVEGWHGILTSLEKNGFAGLGFNLSFLIFLTGVSLLLNVLPFIIVFTASGLPRILAGITVGMILCVYLALQKHHKNTWGIFVLHPAGCILVLYVLWRSAILALRQGGIRWRDTFYSLNLLKKEC